jgi:hypothetical protein
VAGPLSRAPWVFIVFPGAAVQPCQAAGSRCAAAVVAARSALGGPHHDPALAGAPTGVSQSPPGSPGGHRSAPADAWETGEPREHADLGVGAGEAIVHGS